MSIEEVHVEKVHSAPAEVRVAFVVLCALAAAILVGGGLAFTRVDPEEVHHHYDNTCADGEYLALSACALENGR